jgi:hypothetical protein
MPATTFSTSDILDLDAFHTVRPEKRAQVMALKTNRRVEVGPYAVFLFECFETLWWQIHEMLRIEGGGEEQVQDELAAYGPMLPQGNDWVTTMMFEIPNVIKRNALLFQLGHVEKTVTLSFGTHTIKATAIGDDARTTPDGKTSAVHFLRFPFSAEQVQQLKANERPPVQLAITHPAYQHQTTLSAITVEALLKDLT